MARRGHGRGCHESIAPARGPIPDAGSLPLGVCQSSLQKGFSSFFAGIIQGDAVGVVLATPEPINPAARIAE